jgi:cell division protein FtsQ
MPKAPEGRYVSRKRKAISNLIVAPEGRYVHGNVRMNAKTTIRKILFIAVWLCIGGGMLTLLLAAISKKNKGICRDFEITIKGVQNNFFIDEKDVTAMLMKVAGGKIKGQQVTALNLHELETVLEDNTWIDEAEMYFDNKDVLHVTVVEKEPVARIFTTANSSFYIDSAGMRMPLSEKLSARVPVFTGFPDRNKWTKADSLLLKQVQHTAVFIFNHPFWMSQVAQVDITPAGTFEMVPVVGNHIVRLGSGERVDKKFKRLMVFYQQVLSKTGFDKYRVIDVQYNGQVIVSKTSATNKVDSIQLRQNIEKLIKQAEEVKNDTTAVKNLKPIIKTEADPDDAADASLQDNNQVSPEHPDPAPMKLPVPGKAKPDAGDKKPVKPEIKKPDPKKPRAVMPKRTTETVREDNGYN